MVVGKGEYKLPLTVVVNIFHFISLCCFLHVFVVYIAFYLKIMYADWGDFLRILNPRLHKKYKTTHCLQICQYISEFSMYRLKEHTERGESSFTKLLLGICLCWRTWCGREEVGKNPGTVKSTKERDGHKGNKCMTLAQLKL